jgi:GH15 family glucan-1,4-alpha-glucosidase
MTVRISTLDQPALQSFLQASSRVIRECLVSTENGLGLLASPLTGKYPFIYTRQQAVCAVVIAELGDYQTALDLCRFLLRSQSRSGFWVPRYDPIGRESHDRIEPDTTALAVWAILSVVRLANDDGFGELAREHIEEAVRWCVDRALNPYIYLMESPAADAGGNGEFDLWNNCAHAAAFAQCHRVYGGDRNRRVALHLRRAISQHLTVDHRFLRGLSADGFPDPRADISMLAPYYFGLWAPTERTVINSVDLIEKCLWNVEIGGFTRILPFSAALRRRPPGPMPHVSAWMARYHYDVGNTDRGEGILRWLIDSSQDGSLPEIRVPRASAMRYTEECRRTLVNFDSSSSVKLSGRRANLELARARKLADLDAIDAEAQRADIANSGRPFAWAHLETLHALKRGGYLDHWSAVSQ